MKKIFIVKIIVLLIIVFGFSYNSSIASSCPLRTVGLSRTNQSGKFNEIIALQTILSSYPIIYKDVELVGVFGPKTENAIKRLQTDNGLPSNGVITQDTLDLLCEQYYHCPFKSMIGRGDELDPEQILEVKIIQSFLKFIPKVSYTGPVTGFFGILTEQAITKFQNAYNLYPTKIMDYDTTNALCKILDNINDITLGKAVTSSSTSSPKKTTSSPLVAVCVADPKNANNNQKVVFLSQVAGGTPPYKYYWSGYASGNQSSSSNVFTGSGSYLAQLTVTDSKNASTQTSCQALVGNAQPYQQPITIPNVSLPQSTPAAPVAPSTYTGNVNIQMTSDFSEIRNANDSINIFWTSSNAETCYATSAPSQDSWNGPVGLTGQKTISNLNISPGGAVIFTLVCNNKNKTEVKYVVIERK